MRFFWSTRAGMYALASLDMKCCCKYLVYYSDLAFLDMKMLPQVSCILQ